MIQVLATHRRRARVEHVCGLCLTAIKVGEMYDDQRCAYDGRAYAFRSHAECFGIAEKCDLEGNDGYSEGCVWEEVGQYAPIPPPTLTAAERARWDSILASMGAEVEP